MICSSASKLRVSSWLLSLTLVYFAEHLWMTISLPTPSLRTVPSFLAHLLEMLICALVYSGLVWIILEISWVPAWGLANRPYCSTQAQCNHQIWGQESISPPVRLVGAKGFFASSINRDMNLFLQSSGIV